MTTDTNNLIQTYPGNHIHRSIFQYSHLSIYSFSSLICLAVFCWCCSCLGVLLAACSCLCVTSCPRCLAPCPAVPCRATWPRRSPVACPLIPLHPSTDHRTPFMSPLPTSFVTRTPEPAPGHGATVHAAAPRQELPTRCDSLDTASVSALAPSWRHWWCRMTGGD
jgi:hypothetical protein